MVKEFLKTKKQVNLNGRLMDTAHPKVMGILNLTPDSFFDGGRFSTLDSALRRVETMVEEGADIIDVGGYSTRPGASDINIDEELARVLPVVKEITKRFNIPVSIDTFRAEVARRCVEEGAAMVNDVSGGNLDANMWDTVAEMKVPYVLMHMRGTPQTMVNLTNYKELVSEIIDFFQKTLKKLNSKGIKDVIIDPGIGFAKTIDQNYVILNNLHYFKVLESVILVGLSRKTMIWKTLNIEPGDALNGTTALNAIALYNGAGILRVHDVKAAKETIDLITCMKAADNK